MLKVNAIAALVLLAAAPASAQAPDFSHAPVVAVTLTNFSFTPAAVQLHAGQPVTLRLTNDASGGHDFDAPAFFAAATVNPADAGHIEKGKVEVAAHQSVDIALVPAAGDYTLKCDHPFHATFGMKGTIAVH